MMMLVTFIGQVMANNTSMFCETVIDPLSSTKKNELVKHNDSILIDTDSIVNSTEECCDIECCNIDCLCIANACSSVAYLNAEVGETKIVVFSEAAYLQQSEQTNSISTLLYRPPIFTS